MATILPPPAGESRAPALPRPVRAGIELTQPVASYQISAILSDDGKVVHGDEEIHYRNSSADTLTDLYLHLYLNAFRSADTLWMREAGAGHRGFAADMEQAGSIDVESLLIDGEAAQIELDESSTIARLPLREPLLPGRQIELSIAWTAHLPRVFARTGWAPGGFTMVGQWYPKLAVYDPRHGGWDREPWHVNSEFFADFGDYDVTLTVPSARLVVASGEPAGSDDNKDGTTSWHFAARGVTDVAWMAAEGYQLHTKTFGGKTIGLALPSADGDLAARYFAITQYSLDKYESWLGAYPWPRLTVVVPAEDAGGAGGMEYPTLVTTSLPVSGALTGIHDLEMVTAHELAHEWFPMQVASNEAHDPWLDEALAEYLAQRVLSERYGVERALLDLPFARLSYLSELRLGLAEAARVPVTKRAWDYSAGQYGAAVYSKGAALVATLQALHGDQAFTGALRHYVDVWRWRHPTSEDFISTLDDGLRAAGAPPVDDWLNQLGSGERVLAVQVEQIDGQSASVTRVGDAALPVGGELLLATGNRLAWQMAAEDDRLDVKAPAGDEIAAIIADPGRKIAVMPDGVAGGKSARFELAAFAAVVARLVEFTALAIQTLGLFG